MSPEYKQSSPAAAKPELIDKLPDWGAIETPENPQLSTEAQELAARIAESDERFAITAHPEGNIEDAIPLFAVESSSGAIIHMQEVGVGIDAKSGRPVIKYETRDEKNLPVVRYRDQARQEALFARLSAERATQRALSVAERDLSQSALGRSVQVVPHEVFVESPLERRISPEEAAALRASRAAETSRPEEAAGSNEAIPESVQAEISSYREITKFQREAHAGGRFTESKEYAQDLYYMRQGLSPQAKAALKLV